MSNLSSRPFERQQGSILRERLSEERRFLQVVAGARQVGKSTLVEQVLAGREGPTVFVSADQPTLANAAWLAAQWDRARLALAHSGAPDTVLAVDEVQKIPGWSETVKRLWDEDSRAHRPLHVVLLGSAPLLMQQFASAHAAVIGVALAVTLQWKISLHCAGAAGMATLLTGVLGMQGMLAFTSVAMVAWSRIRLGRHTIPQTLAGSALGVLIFLLAMAIR